MKNRTDLKGKIKPINTLSLVDKVELRIMEFLNENQIQPGETIPKEMEFAETLGVSRTVIREAFLRLRTLGFIESKKHRGMIFTQPDVLDGFAKVLDPNLLDEETLRDIFELRLILEMGMAEMIFARKTDDDIEKLENIVEREEKKGMDSTKFSLRQEIDFHGQLYHMSGNKTMQRFQSLLLPVFQFVHDNGYFDKDYEFSHKQVTHRVLLDTIKKGSPDKFRQAMKQHLEPHFEKVISRSFIK